MNSRIVLSEVKRRTFRSNEVRSDGFSGRTLTGSISSANAECLSCQHRWRATSGKSLTGTNGGTLVTCPNCQESEMVHT